MLLREPLVGLDENNVDLPRRSFFIETHGCQMNLADSDIVRSVLQTAGYYPCDVLEEADLILTNTCAIRENSEDKIWQRLKYFASLRKKNTQQLQREQVERIRNQGKQQQSSSVLSQPSAKPEVYPLVGVLGCMAERLKDKLLNDTGVNFIAGPDAYRQLPWLVQTTSSDQAAASTQLSLEETYADIQPVRLVEGNTHAFVTITRGCNNMCSFCIVPYTRGRERSRPVNSILSEVLTLREQGYKEVVLLGQNVNSYLDASTPSRLEEGRQASLADGFTQKWKPRKVKVPLLHQVRDGQQEEAGVVASGVDFGELLLRVSELDPEMRIRFQAPHPKNFPNDVLRLISSTGNICNALHMPVQHGSSSVLERMHRGYSRDAYLNLVRNAREIIGKDSPRGISLGLSTDIISGFCGENEQEHQDNLSLITQVGFDQCFTYSYSKREQTYAGLFYADDVSEDVKARRLTEVIDSFQKSAFQRHSELEIGRMHVVLVEGRGKKGNNVLTGRTDSNKRVVFDDVKVLDGFASLEEAMCEQRGTSSNRGRHVEIKEGMYVIVKITAAHGHTLSGVAIAATTLQQSFLLNIPNLKEMTKAS